MRRHDPTYLGTVAAVSGAAVTVGLAASVASGLSIIDGRTYRIGQVGSFVRIPQGYQDLLGVVSEVRAVALADGGRVGGDTGRTMVVELVGEIVGGTFGRGVSQYPSVGDPAHLATEQDLRVVYDSPNQGHIVIGSLSGAEGITARISLDELVTRHAAVLGSTGSGKSTTIASLLRAITGNDHEDTGYPSARVLLLDVHGEYSAPLADVAQVYGIEPQHREDRLYIPYWALDTADLLDFLTGGVTDSHEAAFTDKIFEMKVKSHERHKFAGIDSASITVDTPVPFCLKQLWYELIDFELMTFQGPNRDEVTECEPGNARSLIAPKYRPHAMGSAGPFLNPRAIGIQRPLNLLRSRLLDRRYDFLLRPGPWEPDVDGSAEKDLDELLRHWLGGANPITILDLSGIPSSVLERLVGSILKIVYEALFWSREKTEGGVERPLLVVMNRPGFDGGSGYWFPTGVGSACWAE